MARQSLACAIILGLGSTVSGLSSARRLSAHRWSPTQRGLVTIRADEAGDDPFASLLALRDERRAAIKSKAVELAAVLDLEADLIVLDDAEGRELVSVFQDSTLRRDVFAAEPGVT